MFDQLKSITEAYSNASTVERIAMTAGGAVIVAVTIMLMLIIIDVALSIITYIAPIIVVGGAIYLYVTRKTTK